MFLVGGQTLLHKTAGIVLHTAVTHLDQPDARFLREEAACFCSLVRIDTLIMTAWKISATKIISYSQGLLIKSLLHQANSILGTLLARDS